jgi:heme oxygenase (biliverdin-IX-beta and delta-forming)
MTEPPSMIDLLRARTAAHHRGLESDLRIEDRLSGVDTRSPLIDGYNTFYRECEAVLCPHLWDVSDLKFVSRFRSRKIPGKTELAGSGNPLADLVFPAVGTKAEALGAMYVLEGSTLGGKVILKTLRSKGVSTNELHFLDPHGSDAGALWRVFLRVLERETAPDLRAMNECVSGARKAFSFAAACLTEERTN